MMEPQERFANYPEPIEGPSTEYVLRVDRNPVLRGLPLVLGASLVSRSNFVARYLWQNARLGTIKQIPGLEEIPYTFDPCVTPLGETKSLLDLHPEHPPLPASANATSRHHSIGDYHNAYKSGATTPLQVAKTLLGLTMESETYKDAWADYHGAEALVLRAAEASTVRWAEGKPLGILDGVPIGVKDDTDVEGFTNHCGMKYNPNVPFFDPREESCWPVKKFQEAGAIVIGKNKMHEIGSDTNGLNVSQGTPTNHHNKHYYPGGSSNGAGSSISAGLVPIAVATDSGGSIRIPSSFNGIYGLKPSHHRTMVMKSTTCVTGPMAANVADLTLAYRVMAQPDPSCPTQGRFAPSQPPSAGRRRVIGVYRAWFDVTDEAARKICYRAIDHFAAERGYEVVDMTLPHVAEAQVSHAGVCLTEMAESARARAPAHDWLSLVGPGNKVFLSIGAQTPAADYLKYNTLRTLMMRHLAFLFRAHPGLLIVTPTTPMNGWPRAPGDDSHGVSDTNSTLRSMSYVFLANLTGTPSISAPVGYVDAEGGKLPVGLMATAEWGGEEGLLAWAGEAEEYLHETPEGRRRPEAWVDVLKLSTE